MRTSNHTFCKRLISTCLIATLFALPIGGCGNSSATVTSTDIITQKPIASDRTPVTVLVKYAFGINTFERAVEEKFPNIDLIQIGNYTRASGLEEYASRLEHDDLPDMVMTWPLEIGEEYWEDRLIDLSGQSFTSRYNISMLNNISTDDKLYYLPGPAQIRGIIYNKTLFEENGWAIPQNFEEFISLCHTIEASGIRSLQLGLKNAEVLDTAFVGYGYGDTLSKPQDKEWLANYNQGNGSFGDHFAPALDTFRRLIDEGILKPQDLEVDYSLREQMLFTRQCAMAEDSILLTGMGYAQTGITDEFAMMPFFNPGENGDWARLYMVCYIGLNKHLTEPANKEKYDLVLQLMDYISTPEGQTALAGDTGGAMFSSLTDMPIPDTATITHLRTALESGRYAVFPELKNAQGALRQALAAMVAGEATKEDVIAQVDAANRNPTQNTSSQLLGSAKSDFSLLETGGFITDAMRQKTGSDIALFMDNGKDGLYNGRGLSGRLYQGDVTSIDISRIMPDLKTNDTDDLWCVTMTGADLLTTLEYAIPINNNNTGWFYYVSGLKLDFSPTAAPGERIKKVSLADGSALKADTLYTVAVMANTVSDAFIRSRDDIGITITQLLAETIRQQGTIAPPADDPMTLVP